MDVVNMLGTYVNCLKDVCLQNRTVSTVAIVSGIGAAVLIVKKLRGKKKRICGKDYPADTVILHVGFSKASYVPSLGHFCVKLHTYLNVTKIPYQVCYESLPSPKGKIPWIEYNGVSMGDSQLIINFLNKEFNVDLNKSLTKTQRAEAWAIQKWLEEFTYWLNVHTRWVILLDDQMSCGNLSHSKFTTILFRYAIKWSMPKAMSIIGVGRHTDQEVFDMMQFDLRQLSLLLGDKQYIMGGDSPAELDCAAFGQLAQIRWATPDSCPGKQLLKGELTNLIVYTDRIKSKFWPNWNEWIIKPEP